MFSLIGVAVAALVLPVALNSTLATSHYSADAAILELSQCTALILLLLYLQYLYFQLMSPANFLDVEHTSEENDLDNIDPSIPSLVGASVALIPIIAALVYSFHAMVDTVRDFAALLDTSKTVIGFVLIPLAINIGSFTHAIALSYRNRLGLAIYNVFQNTMQITLFIIPATVILGWIIHVPMTLEFRGLEAMVFFISVLVVNYIVQTGKGSYLAGSLCTAT